MTVHVANKLDAKFGDFPTNLVAYSQLDVSG